ncbi:MAG: hypothetical protein L0Z54_02850 [Thermoplasmata archaeon]|nr:hypothetical protein [Thermoplasmata archaeon]
MDEHMCGIELLRREDTFVARVGTQLGGKREYKSKNFENLLEQIFFDLREEFQDEFDEA